MMHRGFRVLAVLVLLHIGQCLFGDLPVLSRNLAVNGTFETGLSGWRRVWGRGSLSEDVSHGGSRSLEIRDAGGMSTPLTPFEPSTLAYSLWVRTSGVVVGENPYNVAVVQVTGYGADRKALRHWDVCQVKGTTDWQQFSGTLDLSGQTDIAFVTVSCLVWNTTGTAWFDDLLIGPPYAGPQSAEPADRAVTCARPYDPQSFLSTIIPTPQQLVRLDSQFALVPETRIYVQPEIRRSTADAVNLLNEVVGEHCGSRPGEAVDLPPRGIPPRGVVFCSAGDFPALSGGARISGEAAARGADAALSYYSGACRRRFHRRGCGQGLARPELARDVPVDVVRSRCGKRLRSGFAQAHCPERFGRF
jgi:hypothetical protein